MEAKGTNGSKRYLQNQKILIWKQKVLMEAKDIYKTKRYLQHQKILMVAENT